MNDRERIEELQEEVRQLRALLDQRLSYQWPEDWRLTGLEARFLSAVASAPAAHATKEYLFNALYYARDDAPNHKIFDQIVCKIRRKLPPEHAARLVTVWAHGWRWERAVKAGAGEQDAP